MLAIMLTVVFACVFLAFNIFVGSYINTNVEQQLGTLVQEFGYRDHGPGGKPRDDSSLPDLTNQPKNKIGTQGAVFAVDDAYDIMMRKPNEDIGELEQIISGLKNSGYSLENAQNVSVNTDDGKYYISSMHDPTHPGNYLVFYVSVTDIESLVSTINTALLIIVVVAMAICFIIARAIAGSVVTPIKKLSEFSEDIGSGDFSQKKFSFHDIEFDELGAAMNVSAEKLGLYDNDQRTFFQNVSHELRTPLQTIHAYAEGVEHGLMDPKKSSATIITEADRLSVLVEDLLYISRIDSISQQFEMQENDLRETLSLCAESLKTIAENNGIVFYYQFDDVPVLYRYNEKHMQRALQNLISNAIRYAKNTITLRCHKDEEEIILTVIDDGEGIAHEDLPHIFERFYKGRGGKHGIGLSIVKSVVELHGGEVSVYQDTDTCFMIRFPI